MTPSGKSTQQRYKLESAGDSLWLLYWLCSGAAVAGCPRLWPCSSSWTRGRSPADKEMVGWKTNYCEVWLGTRQDVVFPLGLLSCFVQHWAPWLDPRTSFPHAIIPKLKCLMHPKCHHRSLSKRPHIPGPTLQVLLSILGAWILTLSYSLRSITRTWKICFSCRGKREWGPYSHHCYL